MNPTSKLTLIFSLCLSSACASIGPHPSFVVIHSEVKATPSVQKILAAPTTGTGSSKPTDDINKAVPAAAYKRYEDRLLSTPSMDKVLETLHQPEVGPLLLLNWQAAFYQWVKDGQEVKEDGKSDDQDKDKDKDSDDRKIRRPKKEMHLLPPAYGKVLPKTDKDLKALAKTLRKKQTAYKEVTATVASGKADDVLDAVGTNTKDLENTEALLRHVAQRLQITYLLLSHLDGDEEAFNKDAPVTLHVAMVNLQTGKFRYYARTTGRKSEVPATYPNLIAIMAKNLFEDMTKADRISD